MFKPAASLFEYSLLFLDGPMGIQGLRQSVYEVVDLLHSGVPAQDLPDQLPLRQLDPLQSTAEDLLGLLAGDPCLGLLVVVDPLVVLSDLVDEAQDPQHLAALVDPPPDGRRIDGALLVLR